MKFSFSLTLLCLGILPLFATQVEPNNLPIKTDISAVVVYADGARVTRQTPRLVIPLGTYTFVLKGLAEYFTQDSLQAQR